MPLRGESISLLHCVGCWRQLQQPTNFMEVGAQHLEPSGIQKGISHLYFVGGRRWFDYSHHGGTPSHGHPGFYTQSAALLTPERRSSDAQHFYVTLNSGFFSIVLPARYGPSVQRQQDSQQSSLYEFRFQNYFGGGYYQVSSHLQQRWRHHWWEL